ncbi:hypothetical protein AMTRI_Chr05g71000 [Amborella trichopoda]
MASSFLLLSQIPFCSSLTLSLKPVVSISLSSAAAIDSEKIPFSIKKKPVKTNFLRQITIKIWEHFDGIFVSPFNTNTISCFSVFNPTDSATYAFLNAQRD